MNKSDLVRHVADETGLSRSAAEAAVNAMLSGIAGSLVRKDAVSLVGFGTFSTRSRPARTARNPRTGEPLSVPAATVAAFKPGKSLKDAVNASP
ncbi:MAG: HU family DNA-binding protein [Alphaproteobacteria bacterium]|nr:HU family DNA-binding protein [Alphaproteobacteria bacterium]